MWDWLPPLRATRQGLHAHAPLTPTHALALPAPQIEFKKNLITATAASALIATFFMGALANMPIGIAAGMGVNAYFTYNVVGFMGTGTVRGQSLRLWGQLADPCLCFV